MSTAPDVQSMPVLYWCATSHSQDFFLHGAGQDLRAAVGRLIKVRIKVKVIYTIRHNLRILLPLPLFTSYRHNISSAQKSP